MIVVKIMCVQHFTAQTEVDAFWGWINNLFVIVQALDSLATFVIGLAVLEICVATKVVVR